MRIHNIQNLGDRFRDRGKKLGGCIFVIMFFPYRPICSLVYIVVVTLNPHAMQTKTRSQQVKITGRSVQTALVQCCQFKVALGHLINTFYNIRKKYFILRETKAKKLNTQLYIVPLQENL